MARESKRPSAIPRTPRKAALGLAPDDVSALVAAYLAGASTYELARRYGIRRDQVGIYVRRAGHVVRPGLLTALDDAAQREVVTLYQDGASLRRIAERFGVSDNTVLKALRAQGVPSRPRRGGVHLRE